MAEPPDPAPAAAPPATVPAGYRQGIIAAITVLLGFSLFFLRYWTLEAEGKWTWAGALSAAVLLLSVVLQLTALWRALQVADDRVPEYEKTLRWFFCSAICLLAGLMTVILVSAEVLNF